MPKFVCDFADPKTDFADCMPARFPKSITRFSWRPSCIWIVSWEGRHWPGFLAGQLPLHPESPWRHPVEVSGKRRNQRGAAAVFVSSGSALSKPPPSSARDGGNLMKDLHAPHDDLPTASLDYH